MMKATHVTRVSLALSLFLLWSSFAIVRAASLQAKVTEVQSGNTIIVSNINRALKIRLKGIAPPEVGQPFSEAAREHLRALVMDKTVMVEYSNLADGYLQAKISFNQIDIGSQMLRDGVAWYDRSSDFALNDADRLLYAQCEEAARSEKRGLWSDQNAVAPWAFRRAKEVELAKIGTRENSTFPATQSTKRRKAAAPSSSTSDLFGSVFRGGSSAGAPSVRPVSENGTPDRWVRIDSPREHFSISVPSNSVEGSFGLEDKKESASFHFMTGGSAEAFFIFVSAVGPQMPAGAADISDQMIQNLIAGMNDGASQHGERDRLLVIKSSRAVNMPGISGKDYTLRSDAFGGTARVLTRRYGEAQEIFVMLTLTRAGSESLGSRFINSFKLQ
jgi:endonuclease YncB( thermonuclease family)